MLELLGIGVLTTGIAVGSILLISPDLLLERQMPATTSGEVRIDVLLACGVLLAAVLLAEGAAALVRQQSQAPTAEFNIGAWWSVMRPDAVPDGSLPYIAIERSDGITVEGVLHTYTWSPDVAHRDVALKKPIKFTTPASRSMLGRTTKAVTKSVPYEYVVVPGTEIRHVALVYVRR